MYTELAMYIDGEWLGAAGPRQRAGDQSRDREAARHAAACRARPISTARSPRPRRGFQVWRATAPYERARIMRKAADLVRERAERDRAAS